MQKASRDSHLLLIVVKADFLVNTWLATLVVFLEAYLLTSRDNEAVVISFTDGSVPVFVYSSFAPKGESKERHRNRTLHRRSFSGIKSQLVENLNNLLHSDYEKPYTITSASCLALCFAQKKQKQYARRGSVLNCRQCVMMTVDRSFRSQVLSNIGFAARQLIIPIDVCLFGEGYDAPENFNFRKYVEVSGGIWTYRDTTSKQAVQKALQHLFHFYLFRGSLQDTASRPILKITDLLGQCACHAHDDSRLREGFICSSCLSVHCEQRQICSTCNAGLLTELGHLMN